MIPRAAAPRSPSVRGLARNLTLLLLASTPAASPAMAQDPEASPAGADVSGRRARALKTMELLQFRETTLARFDADFRRAEGRGAEQAEDRIRKFRATARFDSLEPLLADFYAAALSEKTLDRLNAFLATEAGREFAAGQLRVSLLEKETMESWMVAALPKVAARPEFARGANETAARSVLRSIASAQSMLQTSGKVDCDEDGLGEFGFLLEMSGASRIRAPGGGPASGANDFTRTAANVTPPMLSPACGAVDGGGYLALRGYRFRIYLPDSAPRAGWVGEKGPKEAPGLLGGTGKVGTDASETTWCAYAWPVERGVTGTRVFFIDQEGEVLQAANDRAKYSGTERPVPGHAAYLGAGITSAVAVGTAGRDGEIWKYVD
jgi:hypothetical protein